MAKKDPSSTPVVQFKKLSPDAVVAEQSFDEITARGRILDQFDALTQMQREWLAENVRGVQTESAIDDAVQRLRSMAG